MRPSVSLLVAINAVSAVCARCAGKSNRLKRHNAGWHQFCTETIYTRAEEPQRTSHLLQPCCVGCNPPCVTHFHSVSCQQRCQKSRNATFNPQHSQFTNSCLSLLHIKYNTISSDASATGNNPMHIINILIVCLG